MSTARTAVGCLAEDYQHVLARILDDWVYQQERYYARYPVELTDEKAMDIDVAKSFILAVRAT